MPLSLTINPIPYHSSRLAIPPSPFSPRYPVTPPATPPKQIAFPKSRGPLPIPAPPSPLNWLWQCHLCRQTYKLGTTRRCLDDGHRFCAGVTVAAKAGQKTKVKRHRACASEFDYQGWQTWGAWRQSVAEIRAADEMFPTTSAVSPLFGPETEAEMLSIDMQVSPCQELPPKLSISTKQSKQSPATKNCWANCDYPSQCRWGKQSALLASAPEIPKSTDLALPIQGNAGAESPEPAKDFDTILADIQCCSSTNDHGAITSDKDAAFSSVREATDLLATLVESAKQRKRKSDAGLVPSPLAAHPPTTHAPSNLSLPVIVPNDDDYGLTMGVENVSANSNSSSLLSKALDELEFDLRKAANGVVASVVGVISRRDSGVETEGQRKSSGGGGENGVRVQEREIVIKSLRGRRRLVHF